MACQISKSLRKKIFSKNLSNLHRPLTAYESCFCIRFCLGNRYGLSGYKKLKSIKEKYFSFSKIYCASTNLHRPRTGLESCVFMKFCLTNGYGLSEYQKLKSLRKKYIFFKKLVKLAQAAYST